MSEREDVLPIVPLERPPRASVRVPGSKSLTNRALLLAALATGRSVLEGALFSDDTILMARALRDLGFEVSEDRGAGRFEVVGGGGEIPATAARLYAGNAGTAARFLVALVCLGRGRFEVDGSERMRQRPIGELLDALRRLGARAASPTGCPPVYVEAHGLAGGSARVAGRTSSQFLSALLMVAPYARADVELEVVGDLIAKPYVAMTLAVMREFGVSVEAEELRRFRIAHGQRYRARAYAVEPDASSAHYFFAAAAITGGCVRVEGLRRSSLQGDIRFLDVLERVGAVVREGPDWLEVRGSERLDGIDVDMNEISDTAPTLAAIAPLAAAPVRIRGVGHIRHQESNRIAAVAAELRKLGARVRERDDGWEIEPSRIRGTVIDTYGDHRIAMAFSVLGLRVPGVGIRDPACVRKTFPDFYERLEELRG